MARPSNQWRIDWSPASNFAGPVRTSVPESQGGSVPVTGRPSTTTSRSSDSKPFA
jgi:hypothetical protein